MAFAWSARSSSRAICRTGTCGATRTGCQSKVADLDDAGRKDKWAAYQTLYTTLTTLCKLMAPCVPFVTEVMWQNLHSRRTLADTARQPQSQGKRPPVRLPDRR